MKVTDLHEDHVQKLKEKHLFEQLLSELLEEEKQKNMAVIKQVITTQKIKQNQHKMIIDQIGNFKIWISNKICN